jgi:ubiquinone/menaquinone biosynthesis C-methylase UbiE
MSRIECEILHGRKICKKAELIWGWGTPAGQKRVERRANFFIQFGHIQKGKRVLEIGCGTGIFTEKIGETGADITAIDISLDLMNRARERCKTYPNIKFYIADAENMDFDESSFDSIIGSSILHHLNLEPALLEIRRVLKRGGRVVFTEPNMMNPQIMMERKIKPIRKMLYNLPDETAFFRWSLKRKLKNLGFEEIVIKPFDFLHPLTPAPLIPIVGKVGLGIEKTPILKEISGSLLIFGRKA